MRLTPIGYFRIANAMLTFVMTGVAAAPLPGLWSIIVPLVVGAVVQGVAEAIAELTPSGIPGVANPLKTPVPDLVQAVKDVQNVLDENGKDK